MAQQKPVAYPNLVEQIRSTVSAHAAIHDEVANHAKTHQAALEAKRSQLHVSHMAKSLIESDGKP
jgi:hypothetical protein